MPIRRLFSSLTAARPRWLAVAGLLLVLAPMVLAQGLPPAEPTKAQPVLPRVPLTIIGQDGKRHAFQVEVARTPAEQTAGLMFRTTLAPDQGMIFPWSPPQISQMWMQNTLIPLDMLFIGPHGTIRAITENTVPESQAVIDSHVPVAATLEVPAGTAARLDIVVGDKVEMAMFGTAK